MGLLPWTLWSFLYWLSVANKKLKCLLAQCFCLSEVQIQFSWNLFFRVSQAGVMAELCSLMELWVLSQARVVSNASQLFVGAWYSLPFSWCLSPGALSLLEAAPQPCHLDFFHPFCFIAACFCKPLGRSLCKDTHQHCHRRHCPTIFTMFLATGCFHFQKRWGGQDLDSWWSGENVFRVCPQLWK